MKVNKIVTSGKRKTAVARAMATEGSGKITINGRDYKNLHMFDRLQIEEPVRIAEKILGKLSFDIKVHVKGGGEKGQIEASRLALARAMVKFTGSKELEKAFSEYSWDLLIADIRRKEVYKPGDSRARAKRQSSKR